MAMTFAERMALRKKEAEAGKVTTPLATEEAPKPVEAKPEVKENRWKKQFSPPAKEPRPSVTLDNSSASNPAPTLTDSLDKPMNQVEVKAPNKMEAHTLTKIITMNNIAGQAAPTEGELLLAGDMPEDAIRIKQRIGMLSQIEEGTLKSEMDELKKLIKAAPEACQYLLPEELGQVVRALRSMTDNKLAIDLSRAKPKKAKKDEMPKLTAADLKDLEF